MTTLRQAHKKSYTVITNKLAQDNSLSLRARGLMLYLLSLPDDWKIHLNHLVSIMKEGREQLTAILQELKEAKYIRHHKMGYHEGWQYFVFESPIEEDAFKKFLRTIRVSQELGKPNSSGNTPPLQSTKKSNKETLQEDKPPISPPGGEGVGEVSSKEKKKDPSLIPYGNHVKLKPGIYEEFCIDPGKPVIDSLIEEMNDYIDSKGLKGYKDYAAALRNWLRRRKNDPKTSSPTAQASPQLDKAYEDYRDRFYSLSDPYIIDRVGFIERAGGSFIHRGRKYNINTVEDFQQLQIRLYGKCLTW